MGNELLTRICWQCLPPSGVIRWLTAAVIGSWMLVALCRSAVAIAESAGEFLTALRRVRLHDSRRSPPTSGAVPRRRHPVRNEEVLAEPLGDDAFGRDLT